MMALMDYSNEFKLGNLPCDLISSMKFHPSLNQFLLVSSWDSSVSLYDVANKSLISRHMHQAPVIDCCFQDAVHVWSGGFDSSVKMFDLKFGVETYIGYHHGSVKCVEHCPKLNVIVTGGWDKTVKIWDPRSSECAGTFVQPDKVYTMAICDNILVVGTPGQKILVWDLKNMGHIQQRRESGLKTRTRCIQCFPNKEGFVTSSIGCVAVEYFDPNPEVQKKRYGFNCHRIKDNDGNEFIYPVNTIAFLSSFKFATGGSDGFVNIWDGFKRKHLYQFHQYLTPITSLAVSADGTIISIVSSGIYHSNNQREKIPPDGIYINSVTNL